MEAVILESGAPEGYNQKDYQAAYIYRPDDDEANAKRTTKRRSLDKAEADQVAYDKASIVQFVPLLNDAEQPQWVERRQQLFELHWKKVNDRIQNTLREANTATLEQVGAFVHESKAASSDKIPSTFVVTGPNIDSQDLLFEQLSETLQQTSQSRFVRLRSSEVSNLKAALKKIIRDVTASDFSSNDDENVQLGAEKRRYLDYDLEALHAFTKTQNCEHVFVAFQDSEGFDSSLLSDLIPLLNSWRPKIPFTLLFGIATSVELLQARLLKSVCQQLYGAQFDVVQSGAILETIFKSAAVGADLSLRLGPNILTSMLDRQQDQVAGIQAFISSLKYAHMCHFYANPLSLLMNTYACRKCQPEHLQAVRNSIGFKAIVELCLKNQHQMEHTRRMLIDDQYLRQGILSIPNAATRYANNVLRGLFIMEAAGCLQSEWSREYIRILVEGLSPTPDSDFAVAMRQMEVTGMIEFLEKVIHMYCEGDPNVNLPSLEEGNDDILQAKLGRQLQQLKKLQEMAEAKNMTLRSKYSKQSTVTRTTVIAQRVQLSKAKAALRPEDKEFTAIIDEVVTLIIDHHDIPKVEHTWLSDVWVYDSTSPSQNVLIPRPRAIFERSLTRPHDYLNCECCKGGEGGIAATLPATCILYHLYLETGSLINVADLWTAFLGLVGQEEEDERVVLAHFYRGLAELRALGFFKSSKKKTDHIAKSKWL